MDFNMKPFKFNFSKEIIKNISKYHYDEGNDKELLTPEVTIEPVKLNSRAKVHLAQSQSSHADIYESKVSSNEVAQVSTHFLLQGYLNVAENNDFEGLDFKTYSNSCPLCNYSAPRQDMLKLHLKMEHKDYKPFTCPLCSYSSLERKMLTRHFLSVHERFKPYKCPECDYSASLNSNLKKHILNVHRKNKPHKCLQCPYSTSEKGKLRRHVQSVHLNIRPFVCNLCHYSANRECTLKTHVSTVHQRTLLTYWCGECSSRIVEKQAFQNHLISEHFSHQMLKCRKCDFYFGSRESLNKHSRFSHKITTPKTYECGSCLKVYKDKRSMKIHILSIHLKKKPFKCEFCTYRTVDMRYIRKHIASNHKT